MIYWKNVVIIMNYKEVIMAKIRFIKSTAKNGKITTETIYTWSNIDEKDIPVICQNFIDGFLLGVSKTTYLIKPINMYKDGYYAWSRFFHENSGVEYSFVDENGNIIIGEEIIKKIK